MSTSSEKIAGVGEKGGLAIVLDSPSDFAWRRRQHLIGNEEKVLFALLNSTNLGSFPRYITFACKTPMQLKSIKDDISTYHRELLEELDEIRPVKILALGAMATTVLKGDSSIRNINTERGRAFSTKLRSGRVYTVPSIPPFYVIGETSEQFRDLRFDITKLANSSQVLPPPRNTVHIIESRVELDNLLKILLRGSAISCDLETTGLDPHKDTIEGFGLGGLKKDRSGVSIVIPKSLLYREDIRQSLYRFFFEDFKGKFIFHNCKFDLSFLRVYFNRSIASLSVEDTMLMNYILDERPIRDDGSISRVSYGVSPHGLKTIARIRFDADDYKFSFKEFWEQKEEDRDYRSLYEYLGLDLIYTNLLYWELKSEIEEESPDLFTPLRLITEGSKAFAEIELHGVMIDRAHFETLEATVLVRLDDLLIELSNLLLHHTEDLDLIVNFNPNSPKQVGEILYDLLMLPSVNGRNTDKDTLNYFIKEYRDSDKSKICQIILKYREQSKVLSTYVRGLLDLADSNDRVHGDFHVNGTATGRLSCSNPNLQNIPVLLGPEIRQGFIVPEGYTFVSADYSQLELRVAALYSQDPVMIDVYKHNRDIHREVAAAMFGKDPKDITYEERYAAKYVDFGILYGRSAQSLSSSPELVDYSWTLTQAQDFIDNFLGGFPGLREWMIDQKTIVRDDQYIQTLLGRRRRFPLILPHTLGNIQRQAVNSPIQSLASDFCLNALVTLHRELAPYNGKVLFTVHDSIAFEIPNENLDVCCRLIKSTMESRLPIDCNVPIKVDIEVGLNWGDADKYTFA